MKKFCLLLVVSSIVFSLLSCGKAGNTISSNTVANTIYPDPTNLELYNAFLDHTYKNGDVIYLALGINEGVNLTSNIEPSTAKNEVNWIIYNSDNVALENIQKDSATIGALKNNNYTNVLTVTHKDKAEMSTSLTIYTQPQPKFISTISFSDDDNNNSFSKSSNTLFKASTYTNTFLRLSNYIHHSPSDVTETKKGYTWKHISGDSVSEVSSTGNLTSSDTCGVATIQASSTRYNEDTMVSSNIDLDVIARITQFSFKDESSNLINNNKIITAPNSSITITVIPNYLPSDTSNCSIIQGFTNDSVDSSVIRDVTRSGDQYILKIKPNIATSSTTINFRSTALEKVIGEHPVTTKSLSILVFPEEKD